MTLLFVKLFTLWIKTINLLLLFVKLFTLGIKTINLSEPQVISLENSKTTWDSRFETSI